MKQLILHIGLHKTGTTSIQLTLDANAAALNACGILYPKSGQTCHVAGAHHNLAWQDSGLYSGKWFNAEDGDWDACLAEIEESACGTAIVSSEAFWLLQPAEVEVLAGRLRSLRVRVVMYFRRQDLWLRSWYHGTLCTDPELGSPQEFARDKLDRHSYPEILALWRNIFGNDNARGILFQTSTVHGSVIRHFAAAVGLDASQLANLDLRYNVRQPLKAIVAVAAAARELQSALGHDKRLPRPAAVRLNNYFRDRPDVVEKYSLFSIEHARGILARCAAENDELYGLLGEGAGAPFEPLDESDYEGYIPDVLEYLPRFDDEERAFLKQVVKRLVKERAS